MLTNPTGQRKTMKKDNKSGAKNTAKIDAIEVTPDTLSGRGGLVFFVRYLSGICLFPHIERMFGSIRKNKKGIRVSEIIKQMFCFFVDGTSRHLTFFDQLKKDEGYAAVIETQKETLVSSHGMKRFMRKLHFPRIYHFRRLLQQLFIWRLNHQRPALIKLGIDTMVMDNDDADKRQGVKPTYKDVKGFQPLQMTWNGKIVDAVFRGGDKHSNDKDTVQDMIGHIVALIRKKYSKDVPIIILMDSGFFDQKIYAYCEGLGVGYVCGGKLYKDIKEYISGHGPEEWKTHGKDKDRWEYIDFEDRRETWEKGRRALYCRYMTDKNGQLEFDFVRKDTVIYTNLGMGEKIDDQLRKIEQMGLVESDEIIAMYHGRGSDELVHRGLKDFHPEQLPFEKFETNAAWYYCLLLAFFLFETFKEDVGSPVVSITAYASTVRRKVIDVAVKVCRHGGKIILKVTRSGWEDLKFPRLWDLSGSPPLFQWS